MYSVLLYSLWWENMRKKEGKKRWNLWVRITINHQGLDDKATFLASQYSSRFDYSVDARMTFSRYQKTRAKENLIQWIRWAEKMCYIRWQSLLVFPKKNLPNHFSGHLVWKILWGFAPASAALRHQMSSSTQMSSPAKFHQTPFWSARDCWPIQSSAGADFYYTKWAELVVMNPIFTWEEEAITQTLGLFYGLEVCVWCWFQYPTLWLATVLSLLYNFNRLLLRI